MEVIIMQGIPGSGKSTWIKNNLPGDRTKVVSADHYWIQPDGSYKFDIKKLPEAHRICMNHFLAAFDDYQGIDYLVVDNTNINAWEFSPYVAVAQALDIKVRIVHINVCLSEAIRRQTHRVPEQTVIQMFEKLYYDSHTPYQYRNLIEYHDEEEEQSDG